MNYVNLPLYFRYTCYVLKRDLYIILLSTVKNYRALDNCVSREILIMFSVQFYKMWFYSRRNRTCAYV